MNEVENEDEHTPEVQEIIGRQPSNIIKWGVTVIFFVILSIFVLSWFIKYPDLLTAKVVITTNPPPVTLVTRTSGVLILQKKENDIVKKGDLIAYIQSNTSLEALWFVEDKLAKGEEIVSSQVPGSLGDLQPQLAALTTAQNALNNLRKNNTYLRQTVQIQKQKATYEKIGASLQKQQKIVEQELKLAKEKFATDSILFIQKVTAALDFNQAKSNWLQQQRSARNTEASILNNDAQINLLDKQISDLSLQHQEENQKLDLVVKQTTDELLAQITKYKETYLFIANGEGVLSYLGFLENKQFTQTNKSLFSIIPDHGQIVARAELPIKGSGKVKEAQLVNIRLDNYPYEQFGLLKGKISSISIMPGEDKYWVVIELPDQLRTNLNKTLAFKQQMSGTTEIITEDLRLIERFFYQLRSAIKSR